MASNDLWSQIQANSGLAKNKAGFASNAAQAAQGYKGYGVTPGQGGYNPPVQQAIVTNPSTGLSSNRWLRLAQVGAQKVQNLLMNAGRAVVRPVADVATGKGGKAVHDIAQLSADVTGGGLNQLARAIRYTPEAISQEVKNKPITSTQKKAFGTTNEGDIAKKIVGSTLSTGSLLVGGGEARGLAIGAKAGTKQLLKSGAKNVAAGSIGNAANTLSSNPNASGKQLAKSAAVGAAIGAGATAGGFLIKSGKMLFNKTPAKVNPDVLSSKQVDELTKTTKVNVVDRSSGAIKGKVSSALPTTKATIPTAERPSANGYDDTSFRLQFGKGAKDIVSKDPDKWTYLDTKFNPVKDSLSRVVGVLSHTSSKSTIRDAVNHLVPEIDSAAKNRLIKDIGSAKNHQEIADHLWDAAKNHEARVSVPATPMGKKVSFKEEPVKPGYEMPPLPGEKGYPSGEKVAQVKVSEMGGSRPNNELQTAIEKAHNAGDTITTEKLIKQLPDASTRDAMRSSVGLPSKETKLVVNPKTMKTERVPISEAAVSKESSSIEQKVSRPGSIGGSKKTSPFEQALRPAKSENTAPQKQLPGVLGKVQNKTSGLVNPRNEAAAAGNKDLVKVIDEHFANQNSIAEKAGQLNSTIQKYMKDEGVSHEQVARDVESGALKTKAGQVIAKHLSEAYKAGEYSGTAKGFVEKYYPRSAKFDETPGGFIKNKNSLGKSFKYNNERNTIEQVDANGNVIKTSKYATHADFSAAVKSMGGKTEDRAHVIVPHAYATELTAANNAQTISKLEHTNMVGGGKAIINDPGHDIKGYSRGIIPGKAVHSDAVNLIRTVVHTGSNNELFNGVSRINSFGKRMVTFNVAVHGKNFFNANIRNAGMVNAVKNLLGKTGISPELIEQARKDGVNLFSAHSDNPFQDNKVGSLFKKSGLISKLTSKNDEILFHGYGNRVAVGVYKHVLDHPPKGLPQEEVRKLATSIANETIFNMRPHEQSVAIKEAGNFLLFATKYLTSTMRVGTRALGIGLDKSLSKAAQNSMQRTAIKNIVRGFGWSFVTAQAINYKSTGHFTWQNSGSKLSPVFYVDKSTGKEYHISNFYGQVGDLIKMTTNPTGEIVNKLSPGVQEGAKQIANYDQYKNGQIVPKADTGIKTIIDRVVHAADSLISPFGFQASGYNKVFGSGADPALVTAAKAFGYGSSTINQNGLEKEIADLSGAKVPGGQAAPSPAKTKLESVARQQLSRGIKSSKELDQLKSQMTPTQYNNFLKTGANSSVQREFDKLSNEQKLHIIQKYSPQQLKELNLDSFAKSLIGSNTKKTIADLHSKGFTADQVKQALQKVGYNEGQLQSLQDKIKAQARSQAKASRGQPRSRGRVL